MSNDIPEVPFAPLRRARPQQLTREDLKALSSAEINQARLGGHLRDVMAGVKDAKILEDRAAAGGGQS